jgi:hypothetical protein
MSCPGLNGFLGRRPISEFRRFRYSSSVALTGLPPEEPRRLVTAPPPDARLFAVSGLRSPTDAAAIAAALRQCDPVARVWTDPAQGMVAIASAAPAGALAAALAQAGFPARQAGGRRGSVGRALLFGLLLGVGGLVAGFLLGWVVGLGFYATNPECSRPGSCTLMAPVFAALGALIGGPVGLIAGLVMGAVRRY